MSKAEEREARIRNAKRRDLPQLIFCASIAIYNRWIHQGETVMDTTYPPVEIDNKSIAKICKRISKIEKYRDKCVQNLSWGHILKVKKNGQDDISNAFHKSSQDIVNMWVGSMVNHVPTISVTDVNRVLTYLIYMAFYDLTRLYGWTSQESRYLVMTSQTLANEMIPEDSPLVLLLNLVYWECRDFVMVDPDWKDFPFDGPTTAELYAEQENTELAHALRDFIRNTPASVMRISA